VSIRVVWTDDRGEALEQSRGPVAASPLCRLGPCEADRSRHARWL